MQNVSLALDLVLKGVALKVQSKAGYQACHMTDQLKICLENLEFLIDLKYICQNNLWTKQKPQIHVSLID